MKKTAKSSTSSERTIEVKIFVSDLERAVSTDLTIEQDVSRANGSDRIELCTLITKVMEIYELDPDYNITVEFWSNMCQTFVSCIRPSK